MKTFSVNLTDTMAAMLENEAKKTGESPAEIIAEAVACFVFCVSRHSVDPPESTDERSREACMALNR